MKALSIKEPWSTMIMKGKKTIETRTWNTNYRGPLILCASKNPPSSIAGCAFATANLVDCKPMVPEDEIAAQCQMYPKAHSWFLESVTPIKPVAIKGQLGIFEIEDIKIEEDWNGI